MGSASATAQPISRSSGELSTVHTLFAQSAPAPGRPSDGQAPAPGATTTQTQPADAPPPAPGGVGGFFAGPGQFLIFLVPLAFLLFMSRSQNKKQREIESSLKVGDRVVTRSGAIGKITDVGDRIVKIELAPGVNVQFLKTSIEGVDQGDPKDAKKDDAKDKDAKDKKKDD
jgi:preprotein translocase subunit YajC